MIDWHSHILPGIDDGSRNVRESFDMLEMLSRQGVDKVVATPHFYADSNTVEEFLKKRENAYNSLIKEMPSGLPGIILGAEVCYYPGISNLSELSKLCIENTDLLLLEMPMAKWTAHTVNEVAEIVFSGEATVVLAHIDRYLKYQNETAILKLRESGALMQLNTASFDSFTSRRKAIEYLRKGIVCFLGSDCHNTTTRKPETEKAIEYIRRKLGNEFLDRMDGFGYSIID